jgi:hypothetical protein
MGDPDEVNEGDSKLTLVASNAVGGIPRVVMLSSLLHVPSSGAEPG